MTIKAVVFDLDGTLAEFNLDVKAVKAEVMRFLISRGVPASLLSVNESIFEMLKKARVFTANNGKEEQFSAIRKEALAIALRYELEAANKTSPMPGVFDALKALKSMNLKLAIFTINSEKSTNLILEKFRLKQFFDATVAREAVPKVKPDPAHLDAALRALNVAADEAVVVGDSAVDVKAATALKTRSIGIAHGDILVGELSQAGAVHVARSIAELPALIAQLNRP